MVGREPTRCGAWRAASKRSRFAAFPRTSPSIGRCCRSATSGAGSCGPLWSRTFGLRNDFGPADHGKNAWRPWRRPWSRAVAWLRARPTRLRNPSSPPGHSPAERNDSREVRMRFRLVVDGEPHEIEANREAKAIRVRVDGAEHRGQVRRSGEIFLVRIRTKGHRVRFETREAWIDEAHYPIAISGIQDERGPRSETGPSGGTSLQVRAPMPGRVVRVFAEAGMRVKRGETLVVLEAMKMQNEIPAPRDGTVREVAVVEGESITADRLLGVPAARGRGAGAGSGGGGP